MMNPCESPVSRADLLLLGTQDALQRAQEVTRTTDSVMNGADVAIMSSQAFYDMGDVRRGLEYSRQGTQQAMSASGPECAMFGHYCTGLGNLRSHNLDQAKQEFESALELLPDFVPELQGRQQVANDVRAGLAITQFFRGRTEAIDDIKLILANAEAVGDEYTGAFIAQALSEAYTQMGDFELAKQYLDTALDYYRRNDMRAYLVRVLQLSGNWYEHQGRGAEAEQARTEAHQIREELSLPPVRLLSSSRFDPDESQPAKPGDNR